MKVSTEDRKADIDSMCASMVNIFFQGSERKKICQSVLYDYMKTTSYISNTNTLICAVELLRKGIEQGHTPEEILGDLQLDLQDSWNMLSTTKMGLPVFQKLKVDDIAMAKSAGELFRRATRLK